MRLLALTSLLLGLTSASAWASGPQWPISDMPRFWILGEGNTHVSLDGFYFHTKENYFYDGQINRPQSLEHVNYGNMRMHVGFGFTPRFSVFAQMDVRALYMQNALGSNVSDDDNYGFGDAFLAGRWLLYRSRATDRIYPTEWEPETWIALAEGSWVFPLYNRAASGKPPLGDQSNDFTIMGRLAWYANEWLGISGGAGYTYRTNHFEGQIPWSLRADLNFIRNHKIRFWVELLAREGFVNDPQAINTSTTDSFPNGSYLFKTTSAVARTANLGVAHTLGKEWELLASGIFTASGSNSAKGIGGALGLVWRPYQMPELTYEDYRQQQIRKLQREPRRYRQTPVMHYGFQATIIKVSEQGNYFQIAFGQKDGIKAGDTFQVFAPDDLSGNERQPLALARVQVSRGEDSFLRVDQKYDRSFRLNLGQEVRRVIFEE